MLNTDRHAIENEGREAFNEYLCVGCKGIPRAPYCEGSEEYDLWWTGFYAAEDESEGY